MRLKFEMVSYLGPNRPGLCRITAPDDHKYVGSLYPPLGGRYGRKDWWANPTLIRNLRQLGCRLDRDTFPSLNVAKRAIRKGFNEG